MAAGKSTVAEALARRLKKAAHVRGGLFRRMIITGRVDMTPEAGAEALAQLRLRYELAAHTADRYAAAGFDVVLQDVVIGPELMQLLDRIRTSRRHLIVLVPDPDVLA